MDDRPIEYRAELIQPLLASVAAGECCSVVGINGVGKSNLVQHMLRPDVIQHYVGERAPQLRLIYIDSNMLVDWSHWGLFEGLAEVLLTTLGSELPAEVGASLLQRHAQYLAQKKNSALMFRHCADVVHVMCMHWALVLLFDEFDPLFAQLGAQTLRNLRGLRDRHKYRLMFLTFSRNSLLTIHSDDDWDDIEPFAELFTLRELGVHPLRSQDARAEVTRFAMRHATKIGEAVQQRIVRLSGGHPALIRTLTQAALNDQLAHSEAQILMMPAVRLECVKIWNDLTAEEQIGLRLASRGAPLNQAQSSELLLKGVLSRDTTGELVVFSSLFAHYLRALDAVKMTPESAPILVNPHLHSVYYYGQNITDSISRLEYRLLEHLWQHPNQIRPVQAVAEAVYPGEAYTDLKRLRILARRLRKRLSQLAPDQPVPFTISRMHGYRLDLPGSDGVT